MGSVLDARQGGTGTGTEPSSGQILIGQASGEYLPKTPSGNLILDRLTSTNTTLILSDDSYNQTLTGDTGKVTFSSAASDRTTVNADSNAGQTKVYVASTDGLEAGQSVYINYGGARAETRTIASVSATYFTVTLNLSYTHTAVQADIVRPTKQYGFTFNTPTEYSYDAIAVSGPICFRSGGKTIASFVVGNEYADDFEKTGTLCVRGINLRNEAPVQQALISATSFLNSGRTTGMTAISGLFNPSNNHSSGVSFAGLNFGLLSGGTASGSLGSFRGAEIFVDFPYSDVTSGNLNALNCYIRSSSSISSKTYTTPIRVANFIWQAAANYYCVFPQADGLRINMNLSGDYMTVTQHCGLHVEDTIGTTAYGSYSAGSTYVYGILIEGTSGGVTGTWDANFASSDVQIATGNKLILEGSKTAKGDTYLTYDGTGTTLDCFVNNTEIWNASSTTLELKQDTRIIDSKKIYAGTGNDLEIYHDGTNSIIKNNTGQLSIDTTDMVFTTAGSGLPYGACYGKDIAWQQASAAQNTWYLVSDVDMVDGPLNLITHDGNGKLTVSKAGAYKIDMAISMQNNGTNKHMEYGISVNGAAPAMYQREFFGAVSEEQHGSLSHIISLTANQTVELAVRTTDTGTPTLEVDNLSFNMFQVGG